MDYLCTTLSKELNIKALGVEIIHERSVYCRKCYGWDNKMNDWRKRVECRFKVNAFVNSKLSPRDIAI